VAALWELNKFKMVAVAMVTKVQKMLNSLETKFRPNRWIFVFSQPFLVQDGHHSKPKLLPYGQHVLLPVNIHFH
jgi:hypothetical protein